MKHDHKGFSLEDDGKTHINIFSRGKEELGRLLSHFPKTPFIHPYLGAFDSMEGFWYYVKAKRRDPKLQTLSGHEAKFYGRTLESRRFDEFQDVINDANYHKINQNSHIKRLLIESTLPFDHYYVLLDRETGKFIQKRPAGFDFLIDGFMRHRELFKNGHKPPELDYERIFSQIFEDQ